MRVCSQREDAHQWSGLKTHPHSYAWDVWPPASHGGISGNPTVGKGLWYLVLAIFHNTGPGRWVLEYFLSVPSHAGSREGRLTLAEPVHFLVLPLLTSPAMQRGGGGKLAMIGISLATPEPRCAQGRVICWCHQTWTLRHGHHGLVWDHTSRNDKKH